MQRGEPTSIYLLRPRTTAIVTAPLMLALLFSTTLHCEAHLVRRSIRADNTALLQTTQSLEVGKPVERTLEGGGIHSYQLKLSLDQFFHLVADQRGIDLALTIFDPSGNKIREVNDNSGERGLEFISLVANEAGVYRIEVRSLRKTAPLGSYQIRLERLHLAGDQDRAINLAQQLVSEGTALQARQTKDSLAQAITKYQESLELLKATDDQLAKAVVLNKLGTSQYFLGEYQKAIDYHSQALPLTRSAGDSQAEASTLHELGQAYRLKPENEKALDYLNQALQIWQVIQDRRGEWETLAILGRLYSTMGE